MAVNPNDAIRDRANQGSFLTQNQNQEPKPEGKEKDTGVDDRFSKVETTLGNFEKKFEQLSKTLNTKLGQITQTVQSVQNNQSHWPINQKQTKKDVADDLLDPDVKKYVDERIHILKDQDLQDRQRKSLDKAYELYPELQEDNENHDSEFLKKANEFYETLAKTGDPNAPLYATKLAAQELGREEARLKEKIAEDERGRKRVLSEGGTEPKSTVEKENKVHGLLGLTKFFKNMDQEKAKAFLDKNAKKYGLEG